MTRIAMLRVYNGNITFDIIPTDDESIDIDRETGWFRLYADDVLTMVVNPRFVVCYRPEDAGPQPIVVGLLSDIQRFGPPFFGKTADDSK